MILRMLRIAPGLAILCSLLALANALRIERVHGGNQRNNSWGVLGSIAEILAYRLTLLCVAGILYIMTDEAIRRQGVRDPDHADYRDPPTNKPA